MFNPEVQLVAITLTDGSLAIMQFVTKGAASSNGDVFEREATDEAIAFEIEKSRFSAKSWRRVDPHEIPTDRTFRAAWRDAGEIAVDMPVARDIHRSRLRELRAPLLSALDVEYQRADEAGDADRKEKVSARKQELRDVTAHQSIAAAKTPAALAAAIPAVLLE